MTKNKKANNKKHQENPNPQIKIHALHTGDVCVSPYLPFGGENCNQLQAAGFTTLPKNRLWLPVYVYYIEHPKGKILVDTGWDRAMSPDGTFDVWAQIKSLGSFPLFLVNQGVLPKGAAVDEQLSQLGVKPSDLDYVLLTHLDCDHANGLPLVKDAKHILASKDELQCAKNNAAVRYKSKWWRNTKLQAFEWNDTQGPVGKSYDLFGDGSVQLVNIPGHADGLFAVKVKADDGKYVLLYADGGYSSKSWKDMVLSGIALDHTLQKKSLNWIREQSLDKNCVESLATHDSNVQPHVIVL